MGKNKDDAVTINALWVFCFLIIALVWFAGARVGIEIQDGNFSCSSLEEKYCTNLYNEFVVKEGAVKAVEACGNAPDKCLLIIQKIQEEVRP